MAALDNPNPTILATARPPQTSPETLSALVFDVIRDIRDPEHDHSLEALSVISPSAITITHPPDDSPGYGRVTVTFTPTVPHCSMASVIGLSIKKKLDESRVLVDGHGEHYYKLTVVCKKDAHSTADSINRQLGDKERVCAAFENPTISQLLEACINNLPAGF